jgi:hypothetical protein
MVAPSWPTCAAPASLHACERKATLYHLLFAHAQAVCPPPLPFDTKITGGRNGYGAKLANIFSTKFTVETCDGKRQRRFLQTFSSNMGSKSTPKITACKPSDNWTCITFEPDLAKFDMTVSGCARGAVGGGGAAAAT